MESQNLANTSWAYATLGCADEQLMQAISAAAIAKIRDFESQPRQKEVEETLAFVADLLALSWSLAFSVRMTATVADPLRKHIVDLGRRLDLAVFGTAPGGEDRAVAAADRLPGVPFTCIDLPGIMVIFKPENWEVNRGDPEVHRRAVEWRLLSDWVTEVLPRERCPLAHSPEFDFGFIHRLDVPSSGLVLTAKSFAGHSLLRFQLDTHGLCREYIVVCVNPMDARRRDVSERLSVDKASMRSRVCSTGAPARTFLKGQAHAWPQPDPDNLDTLVAIKILTGRHHQIRAHTTHLRHPPVADGRYGQGEVLLRDDGLYADMRWFESHFRRPAVPLFSESGPGRRGPGLPALLPPAPRELGLA
mmetsp:Transcript_56782/g.176086  ORF Transcript_56782/g.176086 Transcript_56782/m.176086 type:complete len:361 (-) Transcript_56782:26-1108(-)